MGRQALIAVSMMGKKSREGLSSAQGLQVGPCAQRSVATYCLSAALSRHSRDGTLKPMDITTEAIRQLATLARLEVTDEATERLTEKLPAILEYVGQLQSIETETVANPRDEHARLRDDIAVASSTVDAILDQAPERVEKFWKVSGVFS